MTQGVNPSQSPLHLEALPYRGRTSASQSSRGASTLNESGTSTFSALPSDPKTGQLDDRANTNISLRNPPQDDPWWRKTVLTLGLWRIELGNFCWLLNSVHRWRRCERLLEFIGPSSSNGSNSSSWKRVVPGRSRELQCAPSSTSQTKACAVHSR